VNTVAHIQDLLVRLIPYSSAIPCNPPSGHWTRQVAQGGRVWDGNGATWKDANLGTV